MKRAILMCSLSVVACSTPSKEEPTVVINSNPGCAQIAGDYQSNEYHDGSDCEWETEESSYVMRVEQSGCNATFFLGNDRTATGVVGDGSVLLTSSFDEDDGTFTASNQNLTADGASISGTINFSYESDDGTLVCDFPVTITAQKIGSSNNANNSNPLTLEQRVVGAWGATGMCNDADVQAGIYLCPGGRVRGARTLNSFDFLVCGTWTVTEPDRVNGRERFIAVIDPDDPANNDVLDVQYTYNAATDELVWNGPCDVPLERLEGGTTEEDCESSVCTDGGNGPVECGTDCDCGRCNYCESGTCRYGGEGPFGCYRGCSD